MRMAPWFQRPVVALAITGLGGIVLWLASEARTIAAIPRRGHPFDEVGSLLVAVGIPIVLLCVVLRLCRWRRVFDAPVVFSILLAVAVVALAVLELWPPPGFRGREALANLRGTVYPVAWLTLATFVLVGLVRSYWKHDPGTKVRCNDCGMPDSNHASWCPSADKQARSTNAAQRAAGASAVTDLSKESVMVRRGILQLRKRGVVLSILLMLIVAMNAPFALLYLVDSARFAANLPNAPTWAHRGFLLLGLLGAIMVVGVFALWFWKQWGLYAFTSAAMAGTVLQGTMMRSPMPLLFLPLMVAIIVLVRRRWEQFA